MSGPKLSIVADCAGCEHLKIRTIPEPYGNTEFFTIKHFCTFGIAVSESVRGYVLPNSTRTPETCPLLPDARAKFISNLKGGSDA